MTLHAPESSARRLTSQRLDERGVLRAAAPGDVDAILRLIHGLAEYEHEPDAVENTPALLAAALFDDDHVADAHVVEVAGETGSEVVGVALWFRSYSTWTGRTGIWLEDLYVQPEYRGSGYGRALLVSLAQLARDRGYTRVEWSVLDWNEPAIRFYRAIGALPQDEWTTQRLDADAIARVASIGVTTS